MNTVTSFIKKEFIIKKSKFICLVYPINSKDDINNILLEVKQNYKGAYHYCYAYRTFDYEKYSDDGEPSKTAGFPLLSLLTKKDLVNVLVVVVRYFGGIKLGAGGLIRAYQNSLKETLDESYITFYTKYFYYEITFSYDNEKSINNYFEDCDILKKEYKDNIKYLVRVKDKSILDNLNIISAKEKRA